MGSPMYKIVLGMSDYIHSGGPGALVDGLRPVFKESTESAVNPLRVARWLVGWCVGRNAVLLCLILSLGVRRQHTPVFLNTPPHAIPTARQKEHK